MRELQLRDRGGALTDGLGTVRAGAGLGARAGWPRALLFAPAAQNQRAGSRDSQGAFVWTRLGPVSADTPPPPPRRRVSPGQLCGRLAEGWALGPPMELPSPPLPSPSRVECQPGWGRPGCSPGLRGQRREVRLQSKPGRVPSDLARGIAGAGRGNPGGGAGQPSSLGLCLVHHGPNYPEELKG